MSEVKIARVTKRKDSVESYYRLYSILKSVLPQYVGKIELFENARLKDIYPHALFVEDEVVGGYVLKDEGDVAYLAFVGLTDRMRGKSLGSLMVNHMVDVARGLGRDKIRAETYHTNIPTFKKLGFKEDFPGDKGHVGIFLDVQ